MKVIFHQGTAHTNTHTYICMYINIFVVVQVLIKNNILPFNIAFLGIKKTKLQLTHTFTTYWQVIVYVCIFRIKFLSCSLF